MTNVANKDMRWGWTFVGATGWRDFPTVNQVPLSFPKRIMERLNPPGKALDYSVYVGAEFNEKAWDMLVQSFVWIAIAAGNDYFSAATGLHTIIDEITPDLANSDWGLDGVKKIDIGVDDGSLMQFTLEDVMVRKIKITAKYKSSPRMEVTFGIPKKTDGDPGTIPAFETTDVVKLEDCHFYVGTIGGTLYEIECPEITVTLTPKVEPSNVIGLEQQENWYFSNWNIEVEVTGIYDNTNSRWILDSGYPATSDQDIMVVFGDDNDLSGDHFASFELDQAVEAEEPDITFKGEEFVIMKRKYICDAGTNVRIKIKDNQFAGGVPSAYW